MDRCVYTHVIAIVTYKYKAELAVLKSENEMLQAKCEYSYQLKILVINL